MCVVVRRPPAPSARRALVDRALALPKSRRFARRSLAVTSWFRHFAITQGKDGLTSGVLSYHVRLDRLKDTRSPQFCRASGARCRARFHCEPHDKIGTPAHRSAAPPGVLDPIQPAMTGNPVFQQENRMLALYDHIIQLRSELQHCQMTKRERAAARAALAEAIAMHAQAERSLDDALDLGTRAGSG